MKKLIYLFCSAFLVSSLNAKPVSVAIAQNAAEVFYNRYGTIEAVKSSLVYTELSSAGEALYYIFNINNNDGFVIVAADDAARPILGYNYTGQFIISDLRPSSNLGYMLGKYNRQISKIRESNLTASPFISDKWQALTNSNARNKSTNSTASSTLLGPLTNTTWAQNDQYGASPVLYDNDCPTSAQECTETGLNNYDCAIGCVACTMGQIMKFWNYPAQGTGSNSFAVSSSGTSNPSNFGNSGTVSADFGTTTYQWTDMPATLYSNPTTTQINAIATLLFQCGVSVDMQYTPCGSASFLCNFEGQPNAQEAFSKYFGYNAKTIRQVLRSSCASDKAYRDSLIAGLQSKAKLPSGTMSTGTPLAYRGTDGTYNLGHAWVIDGFHITSDTAFHCNWGEGSLGNNGYYTIDDLEMANTYDLVGNEAALLGIQPLSPPTSVNEVSESNLLKLYPNPTNDGHVTLSIENPNLENQKISLIDMLGKEMMNVTLSSRESMMNIDLSNFPNGLYFVRAEGANNCWVNKVIKQ